MQPVTYFVIRIGDQWSVSCSLDGESSSDHPDRRSALATAENSALQLWKQRTIASKVMVNEDDERWHTVVEFGQLFG
ncbi:MAG: hypothetical protein ACOH1P_01080 [Lysobacter sp.]